jgi:hypothetical protein
MANAADIFTRVLADLFPGKSPSTGTATPHPAPAPAQTNSPSEPRVIGQGASNETHITITGVPNLFVDEGDSIVQFQPAFDEHTRETQFGLKILPDLAPHWSEVAVHRCPLKEAIATAIRGPGRTTSPSTSSAAAPSAGARVNQAPSTAEAHADQPVPSRARARSAGDSTHDAAAVVGRITSWGEERFPDRKSNGSKFYTSFAMRLATTTGERTLQGEGLKEAISESGCEIGDVVSVRRLRKIQVPAIKRDGTPKLVDGKQVMWDKWLWSITN